MILLKANAASPPPIILDFAGEKSFVGATELDTKCVGAGQYRRKEASIEEVESYMIYQI